MQLPWWGDNYSDSGGLVVVFETRGDGCREDVQQKLFRVGLLMFEGALYAVAFDDEKA